jgi:hypothetical protein
MRDKPDDAFVERPQQDSTPRTHRISLRVDDDGHIDWSNVTDQQKESFVKAVTNDADAMEMLGNAIGGDEEPIQSGIVTVEHVKTGLEMYSKLEAWAIKTIIKKKSRGLIIIPPEVAEAAYKFPEETKTLLAPDGAQAINETVIPALPEWLQELLLEAGPGARFLGGLAIHSVMSTMQIIQYIKTMPRIIDNVDHDPNVTSAASAEGKQ